MIRELTLGEYYMFNATLGLVYEINDGKVVNVKLGEE